MCAQMKAFFDATGGHWSKGTLVGLLSEFVCELQILEAATSGRHVCLSASLLSELAAHKHMSSTFGWPSTHTCRLSEARASVRLFW